MKINKFLFVLCFLSSMVYAQNEDANQNGKDRKFGIGIHGGSFTQQIELNDNHLTNAPSYVAGLKFSYKLSKYFDISTGVDFINKVSFSGLTYDSYRVPLILGSEIYFGKKNNPDISLFVELGTYLRGVNNFDNFSQVDFDTNTVFGFQSSLGLKYDLSDILYAEFRLVNNRDFSDLLEAQDNNINIRGYSFQFGFGYKL